MDDTQSSAQERTNPGGVPEPGTEQGARMTTAPRPTRSCLACSKILLARASAVREGRFGVVQDLTRQLENHRRAAQA
ncbi:hypothetical protein ACFY1P_28860 [Streptomyces sp. NPDC001407]|uniref:hypothetical protein n=1 Tax=Streptomyces sp. NPDC001407 TaxID=3364573 RepID=UPI00367FD4DC